MDLASLTPLEGGWSGQTFLAEAAGERQVVRIYAEPGARGYAAPEIDAALLWLMRGLVPVPDVIEVRRGDAAAGTSGLLVTQLLPGERGDVLLTGLDEAGLATVGRHVGDLVATLGGVPMLRQGSFVDADLSLGDLGGAEGLVEWASDHEAAFGHWRDIERTGLAEVAAEAQELLDTVERRCLVHSDLNPKNLLVDPDSLAITGVVDWEFAHAGHPFTDLGNVLRFDRHPAYVEAVLTAYGDRHGVRPDAALALGRAADLWALIDLAGRGAANPVATRAEALLRGIAGARDLAWAPA